MAIMGLLKETDKFIDLLNKCKTVNVSEFLDWLKTDQADKKNVSCAVTVAKE